MKMIKGILKKYLKTLVFFYTYLRYRIVIILASSFFVGLLDGIGLTLFIPLLQSTAGSSAGDTTNLGQLQVIVDLFTDVGIDLTLNKVLLIMVIIFGIKGYLRYWENFYRVKSRLVFMKKVRFQMIKGLDQMKYSYFVKADAGKIQNTMSVEVSRILGSFVSYFKTAQGIILLLLYVSMAFLANPNFALLVLIAGVISNFLYRMLYRLTKKYSSKVTTEGHGFQGFLIQSVQYFKYLKATNGMAIYQKKLKDKISAIEQAHLKIGQLGAIVMGSREAVSVMIIMAVMYVEVNVLGGTINGILLSLLFFYRSLSVLMLVQTNWNSFLGQSGAMEQITSYLDELKELKRDQGSVRFNGQLDKIELKDLSYAYNQEKDTLKGINLIIHKNETIAIVGESGSGKTTLVNLISGLLDNYKGSLQLNNVEYLEYNARSFQKYFGYITQEPVIFNDTIANNISMWDDLGKEENRNKLSIAIEKSALTDFINELPEGVNSPLGNNGVLVSGGQKQRISIARELYKNVSLLIMDEATSALDSETEKIIQENIEKLQGEYTMLIIAHRLSTVKNADRIVVLANGEIESEGTFKELMDQSTRFRKMVELQEF